VAPTHQQSRNATQHDPTAEKAAEPDLTAEKAARPDQWREVINHHGLSSSQQEDKLKISQLEAEVGELKRFITEMYEKSALVLKPFV